jgi:hypothetical protein
MPQTGENQMTISSVATSSAPATHTLSTEQRRKLAKDKRFIKAWFSNVSCGVHQLAGLVYMRDGKRVSGHKLPGSDIITDALEFVSTEYVETSLINGTNSDRFPSKCAMYVFSDADNYGNGVAFAETIKDHGLGLIVENSEVTTNPNSGNKIRTWIWQPDKKKILEYVNKYWVNQ